MKRGAIAVLADLSRSLSGGDILNVCMNAIYAGSTDPNPERWLVTQEMMEREIRKVRKAKAEHSGGEEEEPEDDWVSAELIGGEIAFKRAGSS